MTVAAEARDRLVDQIALVEVLADYARANAARAAAEALAVRLARRLTEKWELTDVEALLVAGREALVAVAAAREATP